MSDLFGNHIVGFPTRWLTCLVKQRLMGLIPGFFSLSDEALNLDQCTAVYFLILMSEIIYQK